LFNLASIFRFCLGGLLCLILFIFCRSKHNCLLYGSSFDHQLCKFFVGES
jgi:hypothetical protein